MIVTFRLYDTARHCYFKPDNFFITGSGAVWFRYRKSGIWEVAEPTNSDLEIRDVRVSS